MGSLALLVAVLVANLQIPQMAWSVPIALATGMFAFAFLLADIFFHLRRRQDESATVLETIENQLEQMEDNIQEISWMMDCAVAQL